MKQQETEEKIQTVPQEEVPPREKEEKDAQAVFAEHFEKLEQEAEALKKQFPDFTLREALQDPVFLQLTAPGTGISLEDAYYALHRKEIQKAQASETARKIVSAIQSGSRRPLEAGINGQAPSLTRFDYANASKEERDAFKKNLQRAWGRGEQVYPVR